MKKRRLIHTILAMLVLLITGIVSYISYRADYIQYLEIGKEYLNILNTNVNERIIIFIVTFILTYIFIMLVNGSTKKGLKQYFEKEKKQMPQLINNGAAIILATITGFIFQHFLAGQILTLLNFGLFGKKDPIFNMDYSIYIIAMPIIKNILKMILIFLVLVSIYITGYYIIVINKYLDGIEFEDFKKSRLIKQLSSLVMIGAIIIVIYNFMSQQDILVGDMLKREPLGGSYLTGAGFLDVNIKLWGYRIISILIIFAALKFIKGIKKLDSKQIMISVAIIPISIVVMYIVLAVVDFGFVKRHELDLEKGYIHNNIEATRAAYDIGVQSNEIENENMTTSIVSKQADELSKLPIISKSAVLDTLKNNKENVGLYRYNSAQIVKNNDKYSYLSPREIDGKKEKTESDKIFKYTHGNFGVVTSMSTTNKKGYINYEEKRFKNQELNGKKVTEPRIYYGTEKLPHAIVNNGKSEFDYPTNTTSDQEYIKNRYDGNGGIKLNTLDKLIMSMKTANAQLLFNSNKESNTKVLLNRQVIERVNKILPHFRYDKNPYMVVNNEGQLFWLIDGYSLTNRYPYAQKTAIEAKTGGKERINYVRNSVKVLVNAYTGKVDIYYTEKNEPFTATILKTYPNMLKDINQMPQEIQEQLVYPKYLYDIQAKVMETYHDTTLDKIYRGDDLWELTPSRLQENNKEESKTEQTVIKTKNENSKISLLGIYTPKNRKSISGYLVGECINGKNQLKLYNYKNNTNLALKYVSKEIKKDPTIQKELEKLAQIGTELRTESMVIPFENTLLYVESIYQVFVNEEPIPVLKKVIVSSEGKVGMGDNLLSALRNMLIDSAINIDLIDPQNNEMLLNNIIERNKELKKSLSSNDFEQVGKDLNRITKLIDQLEENSALQKTEKENIKKKFDEIEKLKQSGELEKFKEKETKDKNRKIRLND
ncbi:MAG: UPF0182 family protein [Clostridium sp.]